MLERTYSIFFSCASYSRNDNTGPRSGGGERKYITKTELEREQNEEENAGHAQSHRKKITIKERVSKEIKGTSGGVARTGEDIKCKLSYLWAQVTA